MVYRQNYTFQDTEENGYGNRNFRDRTVEYAIDWVRMFEEKNLHCEECRYLIRHLSISAAQNRNTVTTKQHPRQPRFLFLENITDKELWISVEAKILLDNSSCYCLHNNITEGRYFANAVLVGLKNLLKDF